MHMGTAFDPLDGWIRELRRRAAKLTETHGKNSPRDGRVTLTTTTLGGVNIWNSANRCVIRVEAIDESKSWGPTVWTLAYSERNGVETSRNRNGLIQEAVLRLRKIQVLDDIAQA